MFRYALLPMAVCFAFLSACAAESSRGEEETQAAAREVTSGAPAPLDAFDPFDPINCPDTQAMTLADAQGFFTGSETTAPLGEGRLYVRRANCYPTSSGLSCGDWFRDYDEPVRFRLDQVSPEQIKLVVTPKYTPEASVNIGPGSDPLHFQTPLYGPVSQPIDRYSYPPIQLAKSCFYGEFPIDLIRRDFPPSGPVYYERVHAVVLHTFARSAE